MVEKRFEKLGMPDIERFENYLPTAFNSELTLLQKVNKIIFDLIETNKLTNEMIDYLNKFIEKFDEKLYKTIEDILQVWLDDGLLAEVVREAINEEVIEARDGAPTLKDRLANDKAEFIAQLTQTTTNLVNLDSFAHGDGVTIDDSNIKSAIEHLHALGGGVLYAPSQYLIENTIIIPYDNIHIKGDGKNKSIFKCLSNGKIRFVVEGVDSLPTNPNSSGANNLPPYANLDYFYPFEFGGINGRIKNVGVNDVGFSKVDGSSGSQHCLQFYKCDGVELKNIEVSFNNPQTTDVGVQDNPITLYYCSRVKSDNIKINDNFRSNFGMFVYWSYGVDLSNIDIGNVGGKGLELKHVVSLELNRFFAKNVAPYKRGISVNYGSQNVKLKNIHLVNCDLGLSSSNEFEYSKNIEVDGLKIEGTTFDLQNLKGFKLSNIEIILTNNRQDIYGMIITTQPIYRISATILGGLTKNSAYFTYDGDYDYHQQIDYGGVSHYRLFEHLQQPTLIDGEINNLKIIVNKASGGVANCNLNTIFTQGAANAPEQDFIKDGRIKVKKGHYPLSISNVNFNNFKVEINGDGNSTKTVKQQFFNASRWCLKDVEFNDLEFVANNAIGSGNVPDISDVSFLNLCKLDHVTFNGLKLLPYASYGSRPSTIRAYKDLTFNDFKVLITNLTGTYNPTTIKLTLVTPEFGAENALLNEDYHHILFNGCELKGFDCFVQFGRGVASLNTYDVLKGNRFTNNIIHNTSLNNTTWIFMKDIGGGGVHQPILKQLNTINEILI